MSCLRLIRTLVVPTLLIYACLLREYATKGTHEDIASKTYGKVKYLRRTMPKVLDIVTDIKENNVCSNLTKEIQKLCDKIDNLQMAGDPSDTPKIDLTINTNSSYKRPVKVDVTASFDECMNNLDPDHIPQENAYIWCLRTSLWQYQYNYGIDTYGDADELQILQVTSTSRGSSRYIRRNIAPRDMTRPTSGFRTRREYRTLSLAERKKFHDAMNELYEDKTVEFFTLIHQNASRSGGAHGGVAFLPWHRAFLAFFEEVLRQVDPDVFIPYWDSSKDENMVAGPGLSVIWDDDHLGNGNGNVTSGPFANWTTVNTPLRRNIARGVGSLIRQTRIDTLMGFCRLSDFYIPWENAHNNVHRWVGGTMARMISPADPVFYMHHAFIDYQWEKFREHQLTDCGIDPAFDYPSTDDNNHAADTRMDGMRFLINRDGIADYWTTNWYNYEDTPTCAKNCANSPDLFCDTDTNLCVGEIRFDLRNAEDEINQSKNSQPLSLSLVSAPTTVQRHPSVCRTSPYATGCPARPPPRTTEEYIERVLRKELPLPVEIQNIDKRLQYENKKSEEYPPMNEPIFFQAAPDAPIDCRTSDTCIYDLVSAIVKGRKVTNRRKLTISYE